MGRLRSWYNSWFGNVDTTDPIRDSLLQSTDTLTWKCHVCGDIRPDDKISVRSSTQTYKDTGVLITQNVRYCNDRQECIDGAENIEFISAA